MISDYLKIALILLATDFYHGKILSIQSTEDVIMFYLKKIFKFLSSIKLAVPTMLILLVASVAGTILESRYNAEYAGLKIYKTWWFLVVLFFLGVNILFATLSRLPWKKRHIGFLVTHLGMLILLFGSVLTMIWGIDGSMQIYEKSDSNLVFLQQNVLEVDGNKTFIKRYLEKRDLSDVVLPNTNLKLSTFLPFVDVPEKNYDRGDNLNFKIKSPFFDVVQVLNTELDREVQMGPATFRLVEKNAQPDQAKPIKKSVSAKTVSSGEDQLFVKDMNGSLVKSLNFKSIQSFTLGDVKLKITKIFKNAQIANNKIEEGEPGRSNPALEIKATKGNQTIREIIYQKIPEFSLNPNGVFGYKLSFQLNSSGQDEGVGMSNSDQMQMPSNHPQIGNRIKNTVEFQILDKGHVEVTLFKNGEQLMKKVLSEKEMLVTPWMGIELTFLGVRNATESFTPMETEPKRKMPLPSSAILLKSPQGNESWITENSEMNFMGGSNPVRVYYGRERLFLPFALNLIKFEKNDYPGSEMAMNYKSYVQINGQGPVHEIYMNEPLKLEGYTFYQSSYQITPNSPALTILSVNRDPGRELKYIGSIILCLGIILYTLQKSKRFQAKFNL